MNSNYNDKNRSLCVNKLNKIVEDVNLSRNIEKNIYNITVNFSKDNNIKCIVETSNVDEEFVKKSLLREKASPENISKNLVSHETFLRKLRIYVNNCKP